MIADGLEEEVRKVYQYKGANSLNTVGYREMFEYLEGRCTLPEAVERIQGNTRRYCRKQLTWLKRDTSIRWFHPEEEESILAYIDEQIKAKGSSSKKIKT
jgi:tRNA dimethylallyltransferase